MSLFKKAVGTVGKWIGSGLNTIAPSLGQLAGGFLSGVGSATTDYITRNLGISSAKDLLRMQNRNNLDAALQSARLLPTAQVEGLRAAGINPIAAYGQIGGQLSGGSASPMVATGQSDFGLHSAARLMDAQVDRARAEADAARADASIKRAREQVETDPRVIKADKVGRVASAAKDVASPVVAGVGAGAGAYALLRRKSPASKSPASKSPAPAPTPASKSPASKSPASKLVKPLPFRRNVPRGTNSARVLAPSAGVRVPVLGGVNPDALRDSGFGVRHMYQKHGSHHAPYMQ